MIVHSVGWPGEWNLVERMGQGAGIVLWKFQSISSMFDPLKKSNFQPLWCTSLSSWSCFEHSSTKMGSPNNEALYWTLCLSTISTCSTCERCNAREELRLCTETVPSPAKIGLIITYLVLDHWLHLEFIIYVRQNATELFTQMQSEGCEAKLIWTVSAKTHFDGVPSTFG